MDRYAYKPDRFNSYSLVLEVFEIPGRGRHVLDVGCGRGHLARILFERGYKVTGMDQNRDSLRDASQWCCEIIKTDLENWAGSSGQMYDYLLLADVLEHPRDPLAAIRRLMSLLKEGGTVVLSVPNVAHLYVRLMLLCGRCKYEERGTLDCTHLRFFTRASLKEFLRAAGICLRRMRAASLPWSIILSSAPQRLQDTLLSIDHMVGSVWPNLFAYQWVASGTKGDGHG